ncbi:hypothetical protein E5D57_003314 [Metarhizium anisopliae]|nr:hypothetical protein E5D57_003314 [Metarhizium anisopliae]
MNEDSTISLNVQQARPLNVLKKKSTTRKQKNKKKKNRMRVVPPDRLIGSDPFTFFADNFQSVVAEWISLLTETTPRTRETGSTDPQLVTAFQVVDKYLTGRQGNYLLQRLAFVQLMRLSDFIEKIIQSERQTGSQRKAGYGDATIVIDLYKKAQGISDTKMLTSIVRERRRTGRQWERLAGPSPLFLLVYSKYADTIVSSGVDKTAMSMLATQVQQTLPPQLTNICVRLNEMADMVARSNENEQDAIRQVTDYFHSLRTKT